MSAQVTIDTIETPEPETPTIDDSVVDEEQWAAMREVADRAKARWRAAGIDVDAVAAAAAPTPPPATRTEDDFSAMISRRRAEHEAHAAVCTLAICDECDRYGCVECQRVRVGALDLACADCLLPALLAHHIAAIEIPARYSGAGLGPDAIATLRSRVTSHHAIDRVGEAVRRSPFPSIVFAGTSGTGKSSLASAGVQQVVYDSAVIHARSRSAGAWPDPRIVRARWVSAIDIGLARQRHRLGTEDEAELIIEAIEADLLVLDDLGAEAARDQDALAQVIHARHDANRPTWTTTGLSSPELAARYGGGLQRRLIEGAVIIRVAAAEGTQCGAP